ncbi:MAG: hypothetical protein ACLTMD_09460 [Clostridium sp.]
MAVSQYGCHHLRSQEAVDFINGYYEYMKEVRKIADKAALVEDMSDLDTIIKKEMGIYPFY